MAGYNKPRKKTERLHMLISVEEMAAIDRWAAEADIGSRSEAIRRLSSLGLMLDEMSAELEARYGALESTFYEGAGTALKVVELAGKNSELSLKAALTVLSDLAEPTAALGETLALLTLFPAVARRSGNFSEMAGATDRMQARSLQRLAQLRASFADIDGGTKE